MSYHQNWVAAFSLKDQCARCSFDLSNPALWPPLPEFWYAVEKFLIERYKDPDLLVVSLQPCSGVFNEKSTPRSTLIVDNFGPTKVEWELT